MPQAGTSSAGVLRGGTPGVPLAGSAFTFAGDQWNHLDPALVDFLLANQGATQYLVATPTSAYTSLFMLVTDQPAMALGGYQGWDRIITPQQLSRMVRKDVVRYFLLPAESVPAQLPGRLDGTAGLNAWIRASCAAVPPEQWTSHDSPSTWLVGATLFDCAQSGLAQR